MLLSICVWLCYQGRELQCHKLKDYIVNLHLSKKLKSCILYCKFILGQSRHMLERYVWTLVFLLFYCWYLGGCCHYSGVVRSEDERNHRRARVEVMLPT
jgi:hypothetical protein